MNMEEQAKKIWDAGGYDRTNGQQFRDAEETIQNIIDDNSDEVNIIVDLGCGSGNVTKLLSSRIQHRSKILACDFDAKMIEYADKTHNDGTIAFFVQNIELPWEMLDKRLRDVEGKVDIVWSNRVLHWLKDKQTAANTIGRLLKKGGRCYVNTTLSRDLNEFASNEEKEENVRYLRPETLEMQLNGWKECFNNCGLSKVNTQMFLKSWVYSSIDEFREMEETTVESYAKRFLRDDLPQNVMESVIRKYGDLFLKAFQTKFGEDFNDTKNHNPLNVYYEQFRIIGIK